MEHPLCERCVMLYGILEAQPSQDMHHIVAIGVDSAIRMKRFNWLALCRTHHEELEGNEMLGKEVKQWSEANYWRLTCQAT